MLSLGKIRVTWFILKSSGTFLFTLGLALWFGSVVFFGLGVAPVNFSIAESWELTGTNPELIEQNITPQTIAGALTGASIQRLEMLEFIAAILMSFGIGLLWVPRSNQTKWLLAETFFLLISILLLSYSAFMVSDRLFEIQQTVPIDFSVADSELRSTVHLEFDQLHNLYSTLTKVNLFFLFMQFVLLTLQISSNRIERLAFSGPPRVHYEIIEEH